LVILAVLWVVEGWGYFDEDSPAEVAALDNSGAAAKPSLNDGSAPGTTQLPRVAFHAQQQHRHCLPVHQVVHVAGLRSYS
jgi:hypothetical protein